MVQQAIPRVHDRNLSIRQIFTGFSLSLDDVQKISTFDWKREKTTSPVQQQHVLDSIHFQVATTIISHINNL